jgi:hypothetical protein
LLLLLLLLAAAACCCCCCLLLLLLLAACCCCCLLLAAAAATICCCHRYMAGQSQKVSKGWGTRCNQQSAFYSFLRPRNPSDQLNFYSKLKLTSQQWQQLSFCKISMASGIAFVQKRYLIFSLFILSNLVLLFFLQQVRIIENINEIERSGKKVQISLPLIGSI